VVSGTTNPSTVITAWNWRFRVAFDEDLREQVRRASATLQDPREREVQLRLLDAYQGMLSLDALLQAIEGAPEDADRYLEDLGRSTVLPLPRSALAPVRERVSALPVTGSAMQTLAQLAERAAAGPLRNIERELLAIVFGDDIERLVATTLSRSERTGPDAAGEPLTREDALARVDLLRSGDGESAAEWQRLGLAAIPSFEVDARAGSGFAEYWPRELTGAASDRLTIFLNDDALRSRTLDLTLRHELFGHAYFYERLRRAQPAFVDHGALAFLEGWATWCEWGIDGPRDHADRLSPLRGLLEDGDGLVAATEAHWRGVGYSPATIDAGLLQLAQYPGMQFSYLLGAAWFSRRFEDEDPAGFFDALQERAWGDFFLAWN
jgi:hypothetical protein